MAVISGYEGTVKIGGTAVGEVRNWSMTRSAQLVDTGTIGGGAWQRNRATQKSISGKVECFHDPDNALQNSMSEGAAVTLILVAQDGKQQTVPAIISDVEIDQGGQSGVATRNFSFKGNGAPS